MTVNDIQNILVGRLSGTLQGPVVVSQAYDPQLQTRMTVFTWKTYNGSLVDDELPFGMFAQIEPVNMTNSQLVVRLAPGFPDSVEFPELCEVDQSLDTNLQDWVICRKVVPIGTAKETGSNIWESNVVPLDKTHALRTTRKNFNIFPQNEYSISREDITPTRFRSARVITETGVNVIGQAEMPDLGALQERVSEQQLTPKVKRITTRSLELEEDVVLSGEKAYVEGVIVTMTDTLTATEPSTDSGLFVINSEVFQLGNGQYTKETITAPGPSWPVFKGSRIDEGLNISIPYTEQFVSPPATTNAEPNVEYVPINIHRSLRREFDVPTDSIDAYLVSYPVRANLNLPRVLKNVSVLWNTAEANGDQDANWTGSSSGTSYSLSVSVGDRAMASATLMPELVIDIEDTWASNLAATAYEFYLPYPITEDDILDKFSATKWPVFKPRAHSIVLRGQKIDIGVNVQISAASSGGPSGFSMDALDSTSKDFASSLNNSVVNLPPTLHGEIVITDASRTVDIEAVAEIAASGSSFPTVSASGTMEATVVGSVSPSTLPATSPTDIPKTGLYLLDSRVTPYRHGYARVYAEIFDATVLA